MVEAITFCSTGLAGKGADAVLGRRRKKPMTRIAMAAMMPRITLIFIWKEVYPMTKNIHRPMHSFYSRGKADGSIVVMTL